MTNDIFDILGNYSPMKKQRQIDYEKKRLELLEILEKFDLSYQITMSDPVISANINSFLQSDRTSIMELLVTIIKSQFEEKCNLIQSLYKISPSL